MQQPRRRARGRARLHGRLDDQDRARHLPRVGAQAAAYPNKQTDRHCAARAPPEIGATAAPSAWVAPRVVGILACSLSAGGPTPLTHGGQGAGTPVETVVATHRFTYTNSARATPPVRIHTRTIAEGGRDIPTNRQTDIAQRAPRPKSEPLLHPVRGWLRALWAYWRAHCLLGVPPP